MRPARFLATTLALCGSACSGAVAVQAKVAPFAQPVNRISSLPNCPTPPQPVTRLKTVSMYVAGDTTYSKIDKDKAAARARMLQPIENFTVGLAHLANKYVESGGKDTQSGACALSWLNDWARAGAMRDMAEHESQFVRSVNLAGWAIDYAQIRKLKVDRNAPYPAIDAWLTSMANDMRSHFDGLTNTTSRNNHRYWAGLAATAVAMDTADNSLYNWGLNSARIGLRQVGPTGPLPLELERRSRATHYHLYAAAPLVMTAAIAKANGTDLYSEYNGALHKLVRFATDSSVLPAYIQRLSGAKQNTLDLNSSLAKQNLAWVEFYDRAFPGRAPARKLILKQRPLRNDELGGDLTMLAASR